MLTPARAWAIAIASRCYNPDCPQGRLSLLQRASQHPDGAYPCGARNRVSSPMTLTADILVIGLGAMGSSALYHAAKSKARVIGIDRFAPPHDHGSSHGDTRITRQAIGEGREFVPLVLRSDDLWRETEQAAGRTLSLRCGCLVLASPNLPGDHHGSHSFLQDTIDAAQHFNIAHEVLSTLDLEQRFPQFRLQGDEVGYFEPGAGLLRPEACIEAQLDLARRSGAQIFTHEVVTAIIPSSDAIEVRTQRRVYSAGQVILTAGAWIPKLLGEQYEKLFRIYRQMLCWFAIARNQSAYTPEHFPVFIWIAGDQPRDMMYGIPAVDGPSGGIKIAGEQYEQTVDPNEVPREVSDREVAALHRNYIAPRFPDVTNRALRTTTCLYTVTPDSKFIIDTVPGTERVWFASACSGHGFKHSAAIGEALVSKALGQSSLLDLSPFRLARFQSTGS